MTLAAILEHTSTADLEALLAQEFALPPTYASREHRAFFESRAPELVASGWMGAGKSRVLCQKAWWVARTYPGVTVALFRKTAAILPATTARTFERDVVDHSYIAKRNKSENWWELTNGSRIYFLGLDPDPITGVPSKVGSLDLGWAGVDEAVELSESDWIMLLGRLRDPRMPWHQLAAATNPAQPKHWLRTRMLADPTRELITIREQPLPTGRLHRHAGRTCRTPRRVGRLGKGEWAAAEGVIWTLPDDQVKGPGRSHVQDGRGRHGLGLRPRLRLRGHRCHGLGAAVRRGRAVREGPHAARDPARPDPPPRQVGHHDVLR